MAEIRKDYFTDRITIAPTERMKKPTDFYQERKIAKEACPFCPGNESSMPPADLVLVQREGSLIKTTDSESEYVKDWCVRVVPNKHPLVMLHAPPSYSDSPLYSEPAYGYHQIVVATRNHSEPFFKMSVDQWVNLLVAVQDRVKWFYNQKGVSYVSVSIDHGFEAGATLSHPHIQLITLPRLPPLVEQEAITVQKSMNEMGICSMCSVVNIESGGPRQILTTDFFLAFSPWAPTYAFEFWIFPKKHQTSFIKITQKEINDLALILRATLGGLSNALKEPPFNLTFHISPEKKASRQIHWHIEVYPQLVKLAGLERGTGIHISKASPEQVSEVLGAASRRELAELIGVS